MNRRNFFRGLAVAAASAFAANYLPLPRKVAVPFVGIPVRLITATECRESVNRLLGPTIQELYDQVTEPMVDATLESMAKAIGRIQQSEGRMVTYQRRL